jgi:hypothetical protein
MSAIQLGCLQAALFVAAIVSSSAVVEISPNAAEWPTGEGWALRPQGITGVTHDWDIPDSPLPLDGLTPKITISVPTEFKIDIDLTIHRAEVPSEKRGERLRRAKAMASGNACGRYDVRHLRCRSGLSQAGRHR